MFCLLYSRSKNGEALSITDLRSPPARNWTGANKAVAVVNTNLGRSGREISWPVEFCWILGKIWKKKGARKIEYPLNSAMSWISENHCAIWSWPPFHFKIFKGVRLIEAITTYRPWELGVVPLEMLDAQGFSLWTSVKIYPLCRWNLHVSICSICCKKNAGKSNFFAGEIPMF